MANTELGPSTHRDHFLSLFQSAAADYQRRKENAAAEGGTEGIGASMVEAADAVAELHSAGRDDVEAEPADRLEGLSAAETAKICAGLGYRYLQAKVTGDIATAEKLAADLKGSTCDPGWLRTIDEYLGFFGPGGARQSIPYIRAADAGNTTISIGRGARIGVIGDWGTGAEPARRLLRHVRDQKPDLLIHLGDIYYSGTPEECEVNFVAVMDEVFGGSGRIPIFSLSGNHDMYCGGTGYYEMIRRLNQPPNTQPASFFCLRSEDASWQFLAMDTGLHDYSPFNVGDAVTWVERDEEEWHRARIEEFGGKTVLLSHHPLFSAFSPIGKADPKGKYRSFNPKLKKTFDRLRSDGRPIPAWYWGHEHNLCIYEPYMDLPAGRCLGHSAIPVFAEDDSYQAVIGIVDPPPVVESTKVGLDGDFYAHGFAMLTLAGKVMEAEYFEDRAGNCIRTHSETIA